ncbi:MAG: hypothetical protein ACREBS_01425 [Nitrososphaerales archaeon]
MEKEITKEAEGRRKFTQADIFREADRILHFAKEQKIVLRLLGGVGIWFSSPTTSKPGYSREYNDLDFAGLRKQSRNIDNLFLELGYQPKGIFNKLQGDTRLKFFDEESGRRIDIFLDKFVMCHEFEFKDRLDLCERTLSPADLLLTKLQIIEINKKDIMDAIAMFVDHPLVEKTSEKGLGIEIDRITSYTSSDWGIYKTIAVNLDRILSLLGSVSIPEHDKQVAAERILQLRRIVEDAPKSFGWKMRAKIGDKVKWYELPEQT